MSYLYLALGILLAAAAWLALRSISDQAGIDDLVDDAEESEEALRNSENKKWDDYREHMWKNEQNKLKRRD